MVREMPSHSGKVILVDDEDYPCDVCGIATVISFNRNDVRGMKDLLIHIGQIESDMIHITRFLNLVKYRLQMIKQAHRDKYTEVMVSLEWHPVYGNSIVEYVKSFD